MSIKPSAAAEIRALVATLSIPDPVRRESAIARLAVIGPRAIDRLVATYSAPATDDDTRVAILRVFDAVADPRALPVVRLALAGPPEVAIVAVGALRGLLNGPSEETSTEALDLLVAIVANPQASRALRLAAYDALGEMPADVQQRLAEALASDPDPVVRARTGSPGDDRAAVEVEWQEALADRIGGDAVALLTAARLHADVTPLGDLHRMIDGARQREGESAGAVERSQWRDLRGHLHHALARRGSTVALSDLRETLEQAEAVLPPAFIAALHAIGDASSLEALAAAYARVEDESWRAQLAAAWAEIATREKVTARHPTMKRIATRWPGVVEAISTTSRTTPRRTTRRRT